MFICTKASKLHMTVDYYTLKQQTKKYVYPFLRIYDLLGKLLHEKYISAIDLATGYHQIRLAPEYCENMVFLT